MLLDVREPFGKRMKLDYCEKRDLFEIRRVFEKKNGIRKVKSEKSFHLTLHSHYNRLRVTRMPALPGQRYSVYDSFDYVWFATCVMIFFMVLTVSAEFHFVLSPHIPEKKIQTCTMSFFYSTLA
jgi:hypothetical protein